MGNRPSAAAAVHGGKANAEATRVAAMNAAMTHMASMTTTFANTAVKNVDTLANCITFENGTKRCVGTKVRNEDRPQTPDVNYQVYDYALPGVIDRTPWFASAVPQGASCGVGCRSGVQPYHALQACTLNPDCTGFSWNPATGTAQLMSSPQLLRGRIVPLSLPHGTYGCREAVFCKYDQHGAGTGVDSALSQYRFCAGTTPDPEHADARSSPIQTFTAPPNCRALCETLGFTYSQQQYASTGRKGACVCWSSDDQAMKSCGGGCITCTVPEASTELFSGRKGALAPSVGTEFRIPTSAVKRASTAAAVALWHQLDQARHNVLRVAITLDASRILGTLYDGSPVELLGSEAVASSSSHYNGLDFDGSGGLSQSPAASIQGVVSDAGCLLVRVAHTATAFVEVGDTLRLAALGGAQSVVTRTTAHADGSVLLNLEPPIPLSGSLTLGATVSADVVAASLSLRSCRRKTAFNGCLAMGDGTLLVPGVSLAGLIVRGRQLHLFALSGDAATSDNSTASGAGAVLVPETAVVHTVVPVWLDQMHFALKVFIEPPVRATAANAERDIIMHICDA